MLRLHWYFIIPNLLRYRGECTEYFPGMLAFTQSYDSGAIIMIENRNPIDHLVVSLDSSESFNCCSTRNTMITKDAIPPLHWQIVQIFSQVTDSSYFWTCEVLYKQDQAKETHSPRISNRVHNPQPLDSRSIEYT